MNVTHSPCWSLRKRTTHFLSEKDKLNYRWQRGTIQRSYITRLSVCHLAGRCIAMCNALLEYILSSHVSLEKIIYFIIYIKLQLLILIQSVNRYCCLIVGKGRPAIIQWHCLIFLFTFSLNKEYCFIHLF